MNKKLCFFIVCISLLFSNVQQLTAHQPCVDVIQDKKICADEIDWYKQPQVYNMVAFTPEYIDKYHITVNGLWNGFIGENLSSPFALGRLIESAFSGRTYNSDEEFVQIQHNQDMLVPATILTVQGHRSFQQDFFEDFASRGLNGELCLWDEQADSYWMNALHPGFIDWCIDHGKKAIDAGADIIVLDEIQGNSLIPIYQWAQQYTGISAPGFSVETIEGFRTYLDEKFSSQNLSSVFDIDNIDQVDLKHRIAQTMHLTYVERLAADSLIEQYQLFLESSNFQAKKQLIEQLRAYAEQQEKDLVISANSYALGTSQTFDFWSKGLIFADLIDLFTFENTYTAVLDQTIPAFFRTKWLAWERLAYAATDSPAVILVDTKTLEAINENLFPLFGFSNSLGVLCAEAFANRGSFVNYHFPLFTRERNWKQVESIHGFVMQHKDLYDYSAATYADVGILFLYSEGMRTHMNTYLGCAQALAESHIPFEVIFDGDNHYLNASLSLDEIIDFPVLLVPSLLKVTENQKKIVKAYVAQGGVALVFDGSSLGYPEITGEMSYGDGIFYFFDMDVGKKYFETYDIQYKQLLADVLDEYINDILMVSSNNRRVIVTPYYQKDQNRIVMHVLNYDHIGFFDFLWPQTDVSIKLRHPDFTVESVELFHMDETIEEVAFRRDDGFVEFTVPFLKDYMVAVIT